MKTPGLFSPPSAVVPSARALRIEATGGGLALVDGRGRAGGVDLARLWLLGWWEFSDECGFLLLCGHGRQRRKGGKRRTREMALAIGKTDNVLLPIGCCLDTILFSMNFLSWSRQRR